MTTALREKATQIDKQMWLNWLEKKLTLIPVSQNMISHLSYQPSMLEEFSHPPISEDSLPKTGSIFHLIYLSAHILVWPLIQQSVAILPRNFISVISCLTTSSCPSLSMSALEWWGISYSLWLQSKASCQKLRAYKGFLVITDALFRMVFHHWELWGFYVEQCLG